MTQLMGHTHTSPTVQSCPTGTAGGPTGPASMRGARPSAEGCPQAAPWEAALVLSLSRTPTSVGDTASRPCSSSVSQDGFWARGPPCLQTRFWTGPPPSSLSWSVQARESHCSWGRAWGPSVPVSFRPISVCPQGSQAPCFLSAQQEIQKPVSALVTFKAPGPPRCWPSCGQPGSGIVTGHWISCASGPPQLQPVRHRIKTSCFQILPMYLIPSCQASGICEPGWE